MKYFLVGMPLCGKSSLAKIIGKEINISFIDLDKEIEIVEKRSINEIFNIKGEGYFRKIESEVLNSIIKSNESFIMATGGGTPCYNDNMKIINNNGVSIFLDVKISELENRLKNKKDRPLLSRHPDKGQILKKIYDERKSYYHESNYTISDIKDQKTEILSIIRQLKS